jgi:uncharacterized membrane protein
MTTTTIIIACLVLVVLNFLSVFAGLATLRWMDRRQKLAIANIFMRELGEKLETEASFQDIIKNMTNGVKEPEKDKDE